MVRGIDDLLHDDFTCPHNVRTALPTTTEKPWARHFSHLPTYSLHNNGLDTLDAVLGEEEGDDVARINQPLLYAFPNPPQFISSEGDVTRVFHEQVSGPVMTAWVSYPRIVHRNQIGPPGSTSFPGTVDCCFMYLNSCILIGELKAPGVITGQWSNPNTTSSTKSRLGKELRGYAYNYKCPQTFCYDGLNLLIVRFKASSREDIKTCAADCWVVPCVSTDTTCSIRYALYRLMSEGFHRVISQFNNPAVTIGSSQRNFEWYSGRTCWMDGNRTLSSDPPEGYNRVFYRQQRQWAWSCGTQFYAWDTIPFSV